LIPLKTMRRSTPHRHDNRPSTVTIIDPGGQVVNLSDVAATSSAWRRFDVALRCRLEKRPDPRRNHDAGGCG
jgi:hypothetical protein